MLVRLILIIHLTIYITLSGFFQHIFFSFSWILVVTIALFIITKGHIYKEIITMKRLYWIITFCLLFILGVVITFIMRYTLFKRFPEVVTFIVFFMKASFIFITIVAYLNLFHFVQSKSKVMANKTWWR